MGDALEHFNKDIKVLLDKLKRNEEEAVIKKIMELSSRLLELRKNNLLKINHSVLEMVVARHLIKKGYEVELEERVDGNLTCDVLATKGLGTMIVEVETGYVPPSHALDPVNYIRARIASKIARYSQFCHKFVLGAPPHYIMPLPELLVLPPRARKKEDLWKVKRYCDMYYSNPPVTLDEIANSRIHSIFIIDVESGYVLEKDPQEYHKKAQEWYIDNFSSTE